MTLLLLRSTLLVVGLVSLGFAGAIGARSTAPTEGYHETPKLLIDDDGGRPLFNGAELAPGRALSRCHTVTYAGRGASDVSLSVSTNGAGPLDKFIRLQVEAMSGAGCAPNDKHGSAVLSQTLAKTAQRRPLPVAAPGGHSQWSKDDRVSYRITVELAPRVPPRLQGTRAGRIDFSWSTDPPKH